MKKKMPSKRDVVRNETLGAYSDCNELSKAERNLEFKASLPVSGDEFVEIMREATPDGYNDFNADAAQRVVFFFGSDAHYVIAREGSPCVYVKPVKRSWFGRGVNIASLADEVSYEGAGIFRVWWD